MSVSLIIESISPDDRAVKMTVSKHNETCKLIAIESIYSHADIILNEEELKELKEYL